MEKFKCNIDTLKNKFSKDISDIGYSSPMLDKTLSDTIDKLIYYKNRDLIDLFANVLSYDSSFGRYYFRENAKNFS